MDMFVQQHSAALSFRGHRWIVDSGCTRHIVRDREQFTDYRSLEDQHVLVANGQQVPVAGVGTLTEIVRDVDGTPHTIDLEHVLHVPTFPRPLLSTRMRERTQVIYDTSTDSRSEVLLCAGAC